MIQERIKQGIQDSVDLKQKLVSDAEMITLIQQLVDLCIDCFGRDGKLLFCGNGGSAADAQHLAAEFSGRFYFDRPPLYAEALHVNTSYLTAVGNDYGYEESYARMVKAMGRKGDVLFAMSTSGSSPNILRAVAVAKEQGMTIVGLTGQTGGKLAEHCDYLLAIPSKDTPRIQECHMLVGHLICELVEEGMFG
jgi:D-sedoheptulose 7-phosphate isomerase